MNSYFNDSWKFFKTDIKTAYSDVSGLFASFKDVCIPHDWLIENSKDLYETSSGWYYKEVDFERTSAHTFLRFDGVYMDSEVYVNDVKVFEWKYGYSTFTFEITDYINPGKNIIVVHVRHENPNSRWYSGAGIFRNVHLIEKSEAYLPEDGNYVHISPLGNGDFGINIESEVFVSGISEEKPSNLKGFKTVYTLTAPDGKTTVLGEGDYVGIASDIFKSRYIKAKEELLHECPEGYREADFDEDFKDTGIFSFSSIVSDPYIWDIEAPNLYKLNVKLCYEGSDEEPLEILDECDFKIGFKTVVFDCNKGFFLNGRNIKLNGVCEHHDLGALGSAFNREAMIRKLRMLKKMGVNALRTSHNMPDPQVMELCDEMGVLVDNEAFDMWEMPLTKYDYARFFPEWSQRDVFSWIRRDRNHVSNIMWSIGNEIPDTVNGEKGVLITKHLISHVLVFDPYINSHVTIGSNFMEWEKARNCSAVLKYAGYNYGERMYENHHKDHPDWIIYGSETASLVTSRGVYHFPLDEPIMSDEDGQCSSLGNSTSSWGAKNVESCVYIDRDTPFSLGQFLWSGFDYIGEPTPYNSKNSYFGQLDTAGFPKDQYYCFMAEWTDEETNPFVHLYPYWNWNDGQIIDVRACSTGASVELFLNGKSLGRKFINHTDGKELIPTWKVPFEKGEILAISYDETGKELARDRHVTFGDSVKPVIHVEQGAKYSLVKNDFQNEASLVIEPDGRELYFVDISMSDKDGNIVENAMDYVFVNVKNGKLKGMDNGDSTDYDSYQSASRKLFNGKLLAIIEPDGLEPVYVDVSKSDKLIQVRQIKLSHDDSLKLTKECNTAIVNVEILPEDADDKEFSYKIINRAGIELDFAEITKIDDSHIKVTAYGNGEGYLRVTSKSGSEIVRIMSQLEISSEGLGERYMNPYKFVSAGLNSHVIAGCRGGNDKGIATVDNARSGIVFENMDFGESGTDEMILTLFTFSDSIYEIELYKGDATEEGKAQLIDVLKYKQPCDWNVYKPQTFKLPYTLKGLQTISLIAHCRLHIKGFEFLKQEKAFSKINAAAYDGIFGDSYNVEGASVNNIGNNVCLSFDNMDFGENGAGGIVVEGKTPLKEMTIRLKFTNKKGEADVQSFSVTGVQSVHTCSIKRIKGQGKIEFIFLPGTQFDFDSFKFTE